VCRVREPEASAEECFDSCIRLSRERPNVRPLAGSVRDGDQFEFLQFVFDLCIDFVVVSLLFSRKSPLS
jgi:hypothetical protein